MFEKLSLIDIYRGHFKSLSAANGKMNYNDTVVFIFLPLLLSLLLSLSCFPNNNIKNSLAVCLSILIGLLLNVLVLILSNIESDKYKLTFNQREDRLVLIKETFYNISFSVIMSVFALVVLFLMDILCIERKDILDLFYIIFEINFNNSIQFILTLFLYFLSIQIFLVLFMIIKRIGKIFASDINFELTKNNDKRKQEDGL